MGKGYKLTSAAGDGPKVCAFFFSDKGCRNGANCKFSHDKAAAAAPSPPSVASSSVVSSESDESDGEIVETKAGAYASLAPPPACDNPFLSANVAAAPAPAAPAPVQAPPQQAADAQQQPTSEKKKRKRKKSTSGQEAAPLAPGESVFDLGKAEDQSKSPPAAAAAATPPTAKKAKKQKEAAAKQQPLAPTNNGNIAPPSFRSLQLPVASFSLPTAPPASASTPKPTSPRPPSPQHEPAPTPPPLPLPTATPLHAKWKAAVLATRAHSNYSNAFNYERAQQAEQASGTSSPSDWIASRPYGPWCASNPAAIAIDCEMCETKCPATGKVDTKALCRISVVNADNPDEVLLDTLVKPRWPVTNYRTWVNGIAEKDLDNVHFTLEHAQTFMSALCSDQTVVVGHAVHNDLLALRMVHHTNVDTAMLYVHSNPEDGTPSLKNLALGVLKREMPEVHDSVNDARVALSCAKHYVDSGGKVSAIEKVYSRSSSRSRLDAADTTMLLVHRLPTSTQPNHISEMFIAYTNIKPKSVPEITFSGVHGKCNVEFTTKEHAELAYATLVGEEREDKTGKKQKRVGLKGGGYVCVRKMKKGK